MKLTCPDCDTSYAVPDGAIGDAGRKVRCKSCSYVWFQEGKRVEIEDDFDVEVDGIEIPSGNQPLPALSQPASSKTWMLASIAMFLLVLGAFFYQARAGLYPILAPVYEAAGYYPNNGVVLANVTLEAQESRRKKRFKVGCVLLNTSDTPQIQPPLAMRILSAGGNILAEDDAYLVGDGRMIEAGEHVDCGKLEVVHQFASADKLLLEIASPLEMGMRSKWTTDISNGSNDEH